MRRQNGTVRQIVSLLVEPRDVSLYLWQRQSCLSDSVSLLCLENIYLYMLSLKIQEQNKSKKVNSSCWKKRCPCWCDLSVISIKTYLNQHHLKRCHSYCELYKIINVNTFTASEKGGRNVHVPAFVIRGLYRDVQQNRPVYFSSLLGIIILLALYWHCWKLQPINGADNMKPNLFDLLLEQVKHLLLHSRWQHAPPKLFCNPSINTRERTNAARCWPSHDIELPLLDRAGQCRPETQTCCRRCGCFLSSFSALCAAKFQRGGKSWVLTLQILAEL